MNELLDAVNKYLLALDILREPYIPAARNAPSPEDVQRQCKRRVAEAEQRLRDAYDKATS